MGFLDGGYRGPIVGRSSRLLQLWVVSWIVAVLCKGRRSNLPAQPSVNGTKNQDRYGIM
jgi:hypothetical protein